MRGLASWLAKIVKNIHMIHDVKMSESSVPIKCINTSVSERNLNGVSHHHWFEMFLRYQLSVALSAHWKRGLLSKTLLSQMETYILSNGGIEELYENLYKGGSLLHGDLQEQNIIVDVSNGSQLMPIDISTWLSSFDFVTAYFIRRCVEENITVDVISDLSDEQFCQLGLTKMGPQTRLRNAAKLEMLSVFEFDFQAKTMVPKGLIDFGDAKVGNPLYDLVALHLSSFRCSKSLLKEFLKSYGTPVENNRLFAPPNCFSRRAMKLCLLHPCDTIRPIQHYVPKTKKAESWEEIEQLIWSI